MQKRRNILQQIYFLGLFYNLEVCVYISSFTVFKVSKETFKKGQNVEEVVYNVLTEVQRKFEPSLLKILFDEFTLKRNPDLYHIYEIFRNGN